MIGRLKTRCKNTAKYTFIGAATGSTFAYGVFYPFALAVSQNEEIQKKISTNAAISGAQGGAIIGCLYGLFMAPANARPFRDLLGIPGLLFNAMQDGNVIRRVVPKIHKPLTFKEKLQQLAESKDTLQQKLDDAKYDGKIPNGAEDDFSLEVMSHAVVINCGHSFDAKTVFNLPKIHNNTCLTCDTPVDIKQCKFNYNLQSMIDDWANNILSQNMHSLAAPQPPLEIAAPVSIVPSSFFQRLTALIPTVKEVKDDKDSENQSHTKLTAL